VVETPIHLLFISAPGESPISQPRCLVVAGLSSVVTLIEDYTNRQRAESAKEEGFTKYGYGWIEENAQVSHTRVERESDAAFHIGRSAISQARDSPIPAMPLLWAKLSRYNLEIFKRVSKQKLP